MTLQQATGVWQIDDHRLENELAELEEMLKRPLEYDWGNRDGE